MRTIQALDTNLQSDVKELADCPDPELELDCVSLLPGLLTKIEDIAQSHEALVKKPSVNRNHALYNLQSSGAQRRSRTKRGGDATDADGGGGGGGHNMQCQVAVQVTESGAQVWRQCKGECDGDTWAKYKKNNADKVRKATDGKRCVAPVCEEHRKIMKDSGTHKSTGLFWWSPADALGAPEITDFPPTPDNFATVPQNGSRPKHDYWLETLKAWKKAQGGSTQETINALEAQAEGADAGAQPAVGEKVIVHVGGTAAAGQVAGIPGVTTVPTLETPTGGCAGRAASNTS